MHPLLPLLSSAARRIAWTIFGASLATSFFALRATHAAPREASFGGAPPPEVHVHVASPPLPAPPAPSPPSPPAPTYAALPPLATPAPFVAPPRALSGTDAQACSRAWADGGVYQASYGLTYVTREYIDRTLENQAELMRSARIVPEAENGHTIGVKLFGVRPGTLLGQLGFQNGDSLRTVEGYPVSNPEKALEVYARLRNARDYHVEVVRYGRRVALLFRVC